MDKPVAPEYKPICDRTGCLFPVHGTCILLVVVATIFAFGSLISNSWLVYKVDLPTPTVAKPLYFYTRERGLWKTCVHPDVQPPPDIPESELSGTHCQLTLRDLLSATSAAQQHVAHYSKQKLLMQLSVLLRSSCNVLLPILLFSVITTCLCQPSRNAAYYCLAALAALCCVLDLVALACVLYEQQFESEHLWPMGTTIPSKSELSQLQAATIVSAGWALWLRLAAALLTGCCAGVLFGLTLCETGRDDPSVSLLRCRPISIQRQTESHRYLHLSTENPSMQLQQFWTTDRSSEVRCSMPDNVSLNGDDTLPNYGTHE